MLIQTVDVSSHTVHDVLNSQTVCSRDLQWQYSPNTFGVHTSKMTCFSPKRSTAFDISCYSVCRLARWILHYHHSHYTLPATACYVMVSLSGPLWPIFSGNFMSLKKKKKKKVLLSRVFSHGNLQLLHLVWTSNKQILSTSEYTIFYLRHYIQ